MSYTPGPWFVNSGEYDATADEWTERPDVFSAAPDVMGNLICEAPTDFLLSMANWEENARLIAAAPALLAACKAFMAADNSDDYCLAEGMAIDAIFQAEASDPQPKAEG